MIALLIIAVLLVCGYLFIAAAVWRGLSSPPPYGDRLDRFALSMLWLPVTIEARFR